MSIKTQEKSSQELAEEFHIRYLHESNLDDLIEYMKKNNIVSYYYEIYFKENNNVVNSYLGHASSRTYYDYSNEDSEDFNVDYGEASGELEYKGKGIELYKNFADKHIVNILDIVFSRKYKQNTEYKNLCGYKDYKGYECISEINHFEDKYHKWNVDHIYLEYRLANK